MEVGTYGHSSDDLLLVHGHHAVLWQAIDEHLGIGSVAEETE